MSAVVVTAEHAIHIDGASNFVLSDKYRDSAEYRDTFARYLSWKKF